MNNVNLREKKERIWYWDTVKFLMIVLMVVGHVAGFIMPVKEDIESLNLFIYTFHMPMFIFIFGLFYKEKDVIRKILFYVFSAILLRAFICVSYLAITGTVHYKFLYENGVPWFMVVLAWCTGIAWLLRKANKTVVLIIAFVISLFTGYFRAINDFLCLSRLFVYFPYFWLGMMIKPNDLIEKIKRYKKYLMAPAACVLLIWAALCFLKLDEVKVLLHLFTGRNPFQREIWPWGCFYRLAAHALTVVTGAAILVVVPQRKIPVISYMGRNTVNVYFWHYSVLVLLFRFINIKQLASNTGGVILLIFIGVALTFILSIDIFNFPMKNINKFIMNFKKKDGRS